ncbi:MAG: HNH endonuclease [Pyrinomonadaceae bacterium]
MPDIDFMTFGLRLNEALFARIERALREIYAFGDLQLRAAWLFYGSIPAAAQALSIAEPLYHQALKRKQHVRGKGAAFDSMSDYLRGLFQDGASMIRAMSERERQALFPTNGKPRLVGEAFAASVESWRERLHGSYDEADLCVSLLEKYGRIWKYRRSPRRVFESAVSDSLRALCPAKLSLQNKAADFEVGSVALEIIAEYETYCWHREQITKHINTQRKMVDNKRAFFRQALESRDGKRCKTCGSTKRLRIDHKHPLSRGGITEIENLQLLCLPCNSKKSNKTDYA